MNLLPICALPKLSATRLAVSFFHYALLFGFAGPAGLALLGRSVRLAIGHFLRLAVFTLHLKVFCLLYCTGFTSDFHG